MYVEKFAARHKQTSLQEAKMEVGRENAGSAAWDAFADVGEFRLSFLGSTSWPPMRGQCTNWQFRTLI